MEEYLRATKRLARKLREIIKGRKRELEAKEVNPESYDAASWAYKQAHFNGRRQELNFIEHLFEFLGDL